MIEYVVNSLGWSLVGFVTGWLVASLRRDVAVIREQVVHEDQSPSYSHHPTRPSLDTATRWLGILVALLAVVTVAQGVVQARRVNDVTTCQARFNAEFADATARRIDLSNEDRKALQTMLLALYRQRGADEARRLDTFEQWVKTVQANERERQRHPLPEYPEGDCR